MASLKKAKGAGRERWLSGGADARDGDLVSILPVVPVPNQLCTAWQETATFSSKHSTGLDKRTRR